MHRVSNAMRLKKVRVQNYRSILDSGDVEIDGQITSIVGMTGSGKTSFLKMISGIDSAVTFSAGELPLKSQTKQDFLDNKISAEQIDQLTAVFEVEESDRASMPDKYRGVDEIEVRRNFDGRITLIPKGNDIPKIDIEAESNVIKSRLDDMLTAFEDGVKRSIDGLAQHRNMFTETIGEFGRSDFRNVKEVDLSTNALRNTVNSIPKDGRLRDELAAAIGSITAARNSIQNKNKNHPYLKLYEVMPKPVYRDAVFKLEDEMPVDGFIADPKKSDTFYSIAVVAGVTPSALQKIRNARRAEIESYLDAKSAQLSSRLNGFWKQETYEFELGMDNDRLTFLVRDKTTGTKMSVLDRSEGFRWWTAFFLEVSTILAQKLGRSIILLDNPATELHDEGKADVLRFIASAASSDQLQIIYSSHERALVDPWRTDRVRITELTEKGTKIRKVGNSSRHDLLHAIRKNIGSPARYSLFGAPVTVFFEGISDMNIVSAVNEYAERQNGSDTRLNKDSFSINAINGVAKAPAALDLYIQLGLRFVIVVDSGTATEDVKKTIDPELWRAHFVEVKQIINRDGDTEDMVHPGLYHAAFKSAYAKILDPMPELEEIRSQGAGKKRTSQYDRWLGGRGKLDKAMVSNQMFGVLMGRDAANLEPEWLSHTTKNFEALFKAIQSKIE